MGIGGASGARGVDRLNGKAVGSDVLDVAVVRPILVKYDLVQGRAGWRFECVLRLWIWSREIP